YRGCRALQPMSGSNDRGAFSAAHLQHGLPRLPCENLQDLDLEGLVSHRLPSEMYEIYRARPGWGKSALGRQGFECDCCCGHEKDDPEDAVSEHRAAKPAP